MYWFSSIEYFVSWENSSSEEEVAALLLRAILLYYVVFMFLALFHLMASVNEVPY